MMVNKKTKHKHKDKFNKNRTNSKILKNQSSKNKYKKARKN